jgi:hypothetical protein
MPVPTNQKLYDEVKDFIMSRYKKNSAFASGAIVKEYKRRGGKYKDDGEPKNLERWFDEKWINVNPLIGVEDDDAYPVFRPTKKVNELTPTLVQEIPSKRLKEQFKLKQKIKGKENLPDFLPAKNAIKGKGLIITHHHILGGKLAVPTLKGLLDASYDKKVKNVDGFIQDEKLSSKTSKVYINPETGQAVVAHRGTSGFTDWFNNAVYAVGGRKAYKMTGRYKEAEKVQHQAEAKYGKDNVSTIGHSQGGLQAELLGNNSHEVITLNKATRPFENTKGENQYDIRSSRDIVSSFNPFQHLHNPFEPKKGHDIIIPAKSLNVLDEHGIETLERLENDKMIGRGLIRGGMIVKSNPFGDNGL